MSCRRHSSEAFLTLIVGLSMAMAATPTALGASSDYFGYQDFGGTWCDAEKSPSEPDDDEYLCWAAAASNVLDWTGWGYPAGQPWANTDAIFAYLKQHWTNKTSNSLAAWQWWFDGTNPYSEDSHASQLRLDGGGFWMSHNLGEFYACQDYITSGSPEAGHYEEAMSTVEAYLREGRGVAIGILNSNLLWWDFHHQITCWGFSKDANGNYTGIYVTDSDDDKSSPTPPDHLGYYALQQRDGKWFLQDYGLLASDDWCVAVVESLKAVPETHWKVGGGDWFLQSNWIGGTPRVGKNAAYVDNGGTVGISGGVAEANNLYVGGAGEGRVDQTGGTCHVRSLHIGRGNYDLSGTAVLNVEGDVSVGGEGHFFQHSGIHTVTQTLNLNGTYRLEAGALTTSDTIIGQFWGTAGYFTQTGGRHETYNLYLGEYRAMGQSPAANGEYHLEAGELVVNNLESIGLEGNGKLTQTGGKNTVHGLWVGALQGSTGTYSLEGGTLLVTTQEYIGREGTGVFVQTGGTHIVKNNGYALSIGGATWYSSGNGSYALEDGDLMVLAGIDLGYGNSGEFIQTGGVHTTSKLNVGWRGGKYELQGGDLNVTGIMPDPDTGLPVEIFGGGWLSVGGTFVHSGGANSTEGLMVSAGTYCLSGTARLVVDNAVLVGGRFEWLGGTLDTPGINLGASPWPGGVPFGTLVMGFDFNMADLLAGRLFLHGGTVTGLDVGHLELANGAHATQDSGAAASKSLGVTSGEYRMGGTAQLAADSVAIGGAAGGTFTQTGGTLAVKELSIGCDGPGTLNIASPAAEITVSTRLVFGPASTCTAAGGSMIHMTGSSFENQSVNASALEGLANLTLLFQGGNAVPDPLEVAGARAKGFADNFALGALVVGGEDFGLVQLVDEFDNGNRGTDDRECLFVHSLFIDTDSKLDLNGLLLFVEGDEEAALDAWVAEGRMFDSRGAVLDAEYIPDGNWTVVPEPATLSLLVLGGLGVLLRRKRK